MVNVFLVLCLLDSFDYEYRTLHVRKFQITNIKVYKNRNKKIEEVVK